MALHRACTGTALCRIDFPTPRRAAHNADAGLPRPFAYRSSSRVYEVGRRRPIGVVAAAPITSERPRRWGDAGEPGANQKAGVTEIRIRGRGRADSRQLEIRFGEVLPHTQELLTRETGGGV